jgi:preprotein translocase subunit SecG
MNLFKELPGAIRKMFAGNNDEIIFFVLIFILSIFGNSRDDRGSGPDIINSNNAIVFIIIAFLFMFIANEGRSDEITLIHTPTETIDEAK